MSPVESAINSVGRALGSFHPAAMPRLARGHYRRELAAWFFLPVMLGAVEGGVVGVIAKNAFAGVVGELWLNIAVAILAGAPAFANVTSFVWASLSHGRNKIRFLFGLQLMAVTLVAMVALAPRHWVGLLIFTLGAVGTRVCWAGVVTLRATVWRANYPRHVRASMAGKLATIQAIMLATVGLAIGLAMRSNDQAYQVLYPTVAAAGLVGALFYRRVRIRGHAALVRAERRSSDSGMAAIRPAGAMRILRGDPRFRQYMVAMFVFGIGNLMVGAPLVIMLRDVFGFGYVGGILVMATIPTLMMPITIPIWSRLLDRTHIVRFRVIHAWAFVACTAVVMLAAATRQPALLWVAAVLKGVAFGGGVLGWNLGHHDFAPPQLTSQYMGVHVTLTGVRGLIGPPVAVAIYEMLSPSGHGWAVFAVCLALNLVGAGGFALLDRKMPAKGPPVDGDAISNGHGTSSAGVVSTPSAA